MAATKDMQGALRAAQALADDASKREARAARARAEAEQAHATATEKHAAAVAKSAAAPDDDGLVDDVTRAATRAQHARVALERATAAHEAVRGEASAAAARVETAQRALRVAELEQRREQRFDELRKLGADVAARALAVVADGARARQLLADDRADALALGAVPSDGLPMALGVLEALLEADAQLVQVDGVRQIRWAAQTLCPNESESRAIGALVALLHAANSVRHPARRDQAEVHAEVAAWRGRATFGEVARAAEEAKARAFAEAHPQLPERARLEAMPKADPSKAGLLGVHEVRPIGR